MMHGGYGMGTWGWLAMGLGIVAVWILLIALLVAAVRLLGPNRESSQIGATSSQSASEILNQRFARGEIDEAEFRERKRVLSEQ